MLNLHRTDRGGRDVRTEAEARATAQVVVRCRANARHEGGQTTGEGSRGSQVARQKLAVAARTVEPPPAHPQHPEDPPPGIGDRIELDLARKQIEALRKEVRSREDEYDTLYGWYRERETELIQALGRLYVADPDGPYWDGARNDDGALQEMWFARRQNSRTPAKPWLAPRKLDA